MKDCTMELLSEEIKGEFENLSNLDPGSEEHSKAVDTLTKLYKLKIEENKNESDFVEKQKEEQLKRDQMAEQLKERKWRVGIEVCEIAVPLVFYSIWMKRGFRFEETGSYCSQTFRNFFSRLKPTRK